MFFNRKSKWLRPRVMPANQNPRPTENQPPPPPPPPPKAGSSVNYNYHPSVPSPKRAVKADGLRIVNDSGLTRGTRILLDGKDITEQLRCVEVRIDPINFASGVVNATLVCRAHIDLAFPDQVKLEIKDA